MMKPSRLPNAFPPVPTTLSREEQDVLTYLEGTLIRYQQARVLVPIEAVHHPELFVVCIERLLRSTKCKRLLILTSASSRSALQMVWQAARSRENGRPLMELFPTQDSLTPPLSVQIRVCISTVRELQLQQIEQHQTLSTAFDLIVAYDFPARLSPVWKRVIERQQSPILIAFCGQPMPEVRYWFERTQSGFTQEPPALF